MSKRKNFSHSRIVDYWKDKYITEDFKITTKRSSTTIKVVENTEIPCCFACEITMTTQKFPNYIEKTNTLFEVWDDRNLNLCQKAHIIPLMLGGCDEVDNLFILCQKCHVESPDFLDSRYFFAYIYYIRKNKKVIAEQRVNEILDATNIYMKLLNKEGDALSLATRTVDSLKESFKKSGVHSTITSKFTIAAVIADSADSMEDKIVTNEKSDFRILNHSEIEYNSQDMLILSSVGNLVITNLMNDISDEPTNILNPFSQEIANYWFNNVDEQRLSVDYSEATTNCWKCGYQRRLLPCQISKDCNLIKAPNNYILLCKKCSSDYPQTTDIELIWDWLKLDNTSLYETSWILKGIEEFERMYKISIINEIERLISNESMLKKDIANIVREESNKIYSNCNPEKINTATIVGILKNIHKRLYVF